MAKLKDVDKFLEVVPPKLLSHSQALVVLLSWFKNNPKYNPRMSQIAKETGIAPPNVTRAFNKLVEMEILYVANAESNGQNVKKTPVYRVHKSVIDEMNTRVEPKETKKVLPKEDLDEALITKPEDLIEIDPDEIPSHESQWDHEFLAKLGKKSPFEQDVDKEESKHE